MKFTFKFTRKNIVLYRHKHHFTKYIVYSIDQLLSIHTRTHKWNIDCCSRGQNSKKYLQYKIWSQYNKWRLQQVNFFNNNFVIIINNLLHMNL